MVANAFVISRLDNCNSLQEPVQSQHVQTVVYSKHACRIVRTCNKYTWASILKQLLWPQVEFCCIFKTVTLVYKFLHSDYLASYSLSIDRD